MHRYDTIMRDIGDGVPPKDIMKRYGLDKGSFRAYMLVFKGKTHRIEKTDIGQKIVHRRVLSDEDIATIKRLYMAEVSMKNIARTLHTSVPTVKGVLMPLIYDGKLINKRDQERLHRRNVTDKVIRAYKEGIGGPKTIARALGLTEYDVHIIFNRHIYGQEGLIDGGEETTDGN